MSARAMVIPPGPQLPEGEADGSKLLRQDAGRADVFGKPGARGWRSCTGDEPSALEELLRRYEVRLPLPLPWRHSGLKE